MSNQTTTTTTITADRETMSEIEDVFNEFVTASDASDAIVDFGMDKNNLRITGTDENIASLLDVIESYEFDCDIFTVWT